MNKQDDRQEQDIFERLSKESPVREGFSDELRRKIERKLEKRQQSFLMSRWASAFGFFCLLAFFSLLLAHFEFDPLAPAAKNANSGSSQASEAMIAAEPDVPVHSALLIGFRRDVADYNQNQRLQRWEYSLYRTLLIAPLEQKLQVTAAGPGLIIPYGQQFWKLETVNIRTDKNDVQLIETKPGFVEDTWRKAPVKWVDELQLQEKVLFAGNKYLAVEEREEISFGAEIRQSTRLNVHELRQFADTGPLNPELAHATASEKQKVTLDDIFNTRAQRALEKVRREQATILSAQETDISNESWTIRRDTAKWKPQLAIMNGTEPLLVDMDLEMPESVVSHDRLCCSWESILDLHPDAIDAVSSPTNDLLAVISAEKIYVYTVRDQKFGDRGPQLTIDLQDNEVMVMAQWATHKYVPIWIDKVGKLFSGGRQNLPASGADKE